MATHEGGLDVNEQRRLALRAMPPGEFRDDYLLYLDGLELKDPDAPLDAAEPRPATGRDPGSPPVPEAEEQRWELGRYVLAGVGSLAFAAGWTVLSALL